MVRKIPKGLVQSALDGSQSGVGTCTFRTVWGGAIGKYGDCGEGEKKTGSSSGRDWGVDGMERRGNTV